MAGPLPTLSDVAELAGVSTATVSRCLNFPDQVAQKTQDKVKQAIKTLGYSPNFGARALAANRTNTIGAIIPTMENSVFALGIQAFQETLRDRGFTLLVASSAYRPEVEEEQIRSLVARGADGLLLIGHARDPAIYHFLDAQRVPYLVTWVFDPNQPALSVGFDNNKAMQSLAQEVIKQGHKQLAFITAHLAGNDRVTARLEGLRSVMAASGLNPNDLRIIETAYGVDNGARAFEQIMSSPEKPTAIFCGNDVLAAGAMRKAREMGVDVPRDISIVGFDNIEIGQAAYPPLTTLQVPHGQMGRHAAEYLIDLINGEGNLTSLELTTQLKIRASLGPAP